MSSSRRTPSTSHIGERDPAATAARIMLRIGVIPVPVAIINDGGAPAGGRVKKPCGPTNGRTAPGSSECNHVEPGPPTTRVTAISNAGDPSGAEAIEYDRLTSCATSDGPAPIP